MSRASDEPTSRPNVVLVLADDLGYSDIGCFGSEIETPNLDALAAAGVRLSSFTNTARCSPSRASMLTGLHPHQTGVGLLTGDDGPGGYPGSLNDRCVTIAEVLAAAGYRTYMSGKWHVSHEKDRLDAAWPTRRGFQQFYGTLDGCGSYFAPRRLTRGETDISHEATEDPDFFYTDAITDAAVGFIEGHHRDSVGTPLFCYVAYTAPHFPLQAPPADIEAQAGRYKAGWDVLREQRIEKLVDLGLIEPDTVPSGRDRKVPPWDQVENPEWEQRRMEVYAAQIAGMDRGIGRLVDALRRCGQLDNTLFMFLSDNGGCAEEVPIGSGSEAAARGVKVIPPATRAGKEILVGNRPDVWPGGEDTYATYGRGWANLSNTPFRLFKRWVHQGGISSPFIAHWPAGLAGREGEICRDTFYMPDILPTLAEAGGATYPVEVAGRDPLPLEGISMLASLRGRATDRERPQFYEHMGNAAVRRGRWKIVRDYPDDWELYDLDADPAELKDMAAERPDVVRALAYAWAEWAYRFQVVPRERIVELARWGIATRD